ncbi:MAG: nickel pincer cofactor biosynthesis protein LarC [Clostridia bacterium]|nr:nickel pincer cofactor biosynthesis protein LarC [Clostridia bacterium]
MKTLYLDLSMGAAGDMLTAALLELLPDPGAFVEKLNAAGIEGVEYIREKAEKCGITGTHVTVSVHGEEESEDMHSHHGHEHEHDHAHGHRHHSHSSLHGIGHIVEHLNIGEKTKNDIMNVYKIIADAESRVHGKPVDEIHFHEVGTMDAVADITAVCLLIEELSPAKIIASPVCTGFGHVHCAHGILPVPAPATANILEGLPTYSGDIEGELCTPTGAALIKYFVNEFGSRPVSVIEKTGYGMGRKDFEKANCVRAFLCETTDEQSEVFELACNLDDMTAEDIAFAADRLLDGGALDVYTIPAGMKKSRPGTILCALCNETDKNALINIFFKYTTTLGVRETAVKRYTLTRETGEVTTPYGAVRYKKSQGFGTEKFKFEADDLMKIAKEQNLTLDEIRAIAEKSK